MTDPEDLDRRVRVLEAEVLRLRDQFTVAASDAAAARSDAAAARVLAGGADRDAADLRDELRAHNQTLNALRETQLEHGQAIAEGFAKTDEKFATMAQGMAQIHTLLERLVPPGPANFSD
ncbi:hypothetical protein ABJI51_25825 [Amycolatopsis sp. NEAU-NG30]|uniref:Uncharacterized protein n=1 Tax=Amycolatopsis melonis TaxID=3156488 RepID=A0ABV0LJP0_9PSEU